MQTTIYEAHLSDYCQTPLIVEGVGEKNNSIFFLFHDIFSPLCEKYFEKEILYHKLLFFFFKSQKNFTIAYNMKG
jgi:hypothetical protein